MNRKEDDDFETLLMKMMNDFDAEVANEDEKTNEVAEKEAEKEEEDKGEDDDWCSDDFPQGTVEFNENNKVNVEILKPVRHPRQELKKLVGCRNIKTQIKDLLELTTYNAWIEAEGTEFSDAANGVVNFIGGKLMIANCTFTNYYLFAVSTESIVNFFESDDGVPFPTGYLDNCILYGMTQEINIGDLEGTDLYLRNCLMKLSGSDDAHFIDMVWKADPKFCVVRDDYIFDYRLKNESDKPAKMLVIINYPDA